MPKFRKKPVEIEAYQLTREMLEDNFFFGRKLPPGIKIMNSDYNPDQKEIYSFSAYVVTIHGETAKVVLGEWVITEPDGIHHYPCKPDIFAATYEPVEQEEG